MVMNSISQVLPRDMYYGSADVASILGLEGAFGSPFSTYCKKVMGQTDPENDFMRWGSRLEDDLLEEYGSHSEAGEIIALQAHYACPEWPKARATLDAVALIGGESVAVEAKTSGDWDWDEVPLPYLAQVMWQLGCAGLTRAHLIVWFRSTCKSKLFTIEFDPELFSRILKHIQEFDEQYVLTGTPPPADGHAATTAALKKIKGNGQVAEIDHLSNDVEQLVRIRAELTAIKAQEEEVTNRIKAALNQCETATVAGYVVCTWKMQTRKNFDHKKLLADHPEFAEPYTTVSESRVFLLKTPKATKK